jgi:thiol-disulfide isomerase/thioredoxin
MLNKFSITIILSLLSQLALFGQAAQGVRVGFVNIGPYAQANAKHNLFCLIDNYTPNPLNSIVLSWQNGNDEPQSKVVENINLFQWDNKLVDLVAQINVGAPGNYLIKFWVSTVNNVPLTETDTLKISYQALEQTAIRFILFENFTSIGCGTCSTANPFLRNLAQKYSGKAFFVAYHTDCYSGNPMCQLVSGEVEERKLLYDAIYTPFSALSSLYGDNSLSFDATYFDSELQRESAIGINGSFDINESTVTGSVTFTPFTSISIENLVVRLAITQDIVEFASAPGSNGEKVFYHVLRRVVRIPNTQFQSFSSGEQFIFDFSEDFEGLNVDISKFRIAAFVQDTSTQNVLQAFELVNNVTSANLIGLKSNFRVYPNPAINGKSIRIELPEGSEGSYNVSIQTIQGQLLYQVEVTSNESVLSVSTENLPKGILIISVNGKNISNSQKVIVQ